MFCGYHVVVRNFVSLRNLQNAPRHLARLGLGLSFGSGLRSGSELGLGLETPELSNVTLCHPGLTYIFNF